jgi:hypothetical protein
VICFHGGDHEDCCLLVWRRVICQVPTFRTNFFRLQRRRVDRGVKVECILKMEAAWSFESLVPIYQTVRGHILEDSNMYSVFCLIQHIRILIWESVLWQYESDACFFWFREWRSIFCFFTESPDCYWMSRILYEMPTGIQCLPYLFAIWRVLLPKVLNEFGINLVCLVYNKIG